MRFRGCRSIRCLSRSVCASLFLCTILSSGSGALEQVASPSTERTFEEAQRAFDQGDFAAAVRGFEQVRRDAPDRKDAWRGLVLCYFRLGDKARGLELAHEAAVRWPNDGETHHLMGFAYFQSGQPEPAIREFLEPTQLVPHQK